MAEVTFRESDHTYWRAGERLPGVTTVLEAWAQQYAGIPQSILRPAQERGTAVHLATHYDDMDCLDWDALSPILKPYVQAWRRFQSDVGLIVEHSELLVVNKRYRYAGTLDRICRCIIKGEKKRILLDIKTGSALGPMAGPQTAAYSAAYLEQNPHEPPLIRAAVELHAEGDPPYRFRELRDTNDLPVFLAALTLYRWKIQQEQKWANSQSR